MIEVAGLKIHLYGLLIGIGAWVAMEIAVRRQKKTKAKNILENVFWWAVMGGIAGARAYHVVDYWGKYYSANHIKIFYVWEGGLGIWGGIAGGLLAVYGYCRIKKIKFLPLVDDLIVGLPLAQAIGRMGNWVNGELSGKNGEPLFAYEAALNLVLFGILWVVGKNKIKSGKLTGIYLAGYGVIRILLEGMRPDEMIWKIGGVPTAIIFGVISILFGIYLMDSRLRGNDNVE